MPAAKYPATAYVTSIFVPPSAADSFTLSVPTAASGCNGPSAPDSTTARPGITLSTSI